MVSLTVPLTGKVTIIITGIGRFCQKQQPGLDLKLGQGWKY
ncbi:unnamed protein product, partial [marine sediment metagenome]